MSLVKSVCLASYEVFWVLYKLTTTMFRASYSLMAEVTWLCRFSTCSLDT